MLIYVLFLLFMTPLCLLKNSWWLVHYLMFLLSFIHLINYNSISYGLFYDPVSFVMILLSLWICTLILTSRTSIYLTGFYHGSFIFVVLLLILILYITFSRLSLFSFYLYFESRLIPTFLLILSWGYQPEHLQVGTYLIFYTLVARLPLLLVLLTIYFSLDNLLLPINFNLYFYIFSVLAFLVKIPIYIIHLWLPKAHVEAPISGRMILAGVILKLGGYGLIRIMRIIMLSGFIYI